MEESIIDCAFKFLCSLVIGVVSYVFLRLINFDALSAGIVSFVGAVAIFLSLLPR